MDNNTSNSERLCGDNPQSNYHCSYCMHHGGSVMRLGLLYTFNNSESDYDERFPCEKSREDFARALRPFIHNITYYGDLTKPLSAR